MVTNRKVGVEEEGSRMMSSFSVKETVQRYKVLLMKSKELVFILTCFVKAGKNISEYLGY